MQYDLLKGPDFQYIYDPLRKIASQWDAIVKLVSGFFSEGRLRPEYRLAQQGDDLLPRPATVCRKVFMTAFGVPASEEVYDLLELQAFKVYER